MCSKMCPLAEHAMQENLSEPQCFGLDIVIPLMNIKQLL